MKTIKELRTEKGWSLAEVGQRVGVTPQAVHYWEKGIDVPNVRRLRQLAEVFGVCSDHIKLPALNGKDEGETHG